MLASKVKGEGRREPHVPQKEPLGFLKKMSRPLQLRILKPEN